MGRPAVPTLVGWYERQGFVRAGTFDYHGWIGQVFEKAIPAAAEGEVVDG